MHSGKKGRTVGRAVGNAKARDDLRQIGFATCVVEAIEAFDIDMLDAHPRRDGPASDEEAVLKIT